jgi:hypothetical protein
VKLDHKREMRRLMKKGHSPSKAAHVVHKMQSKLNVSTIAPETGSSEVENADMEPGQMAHGGTKGHGHDGMSCAAAGCSMARGGEMPTGGAPTGKTAKMPKVH